ncbi:hypothetical protein ABW19_dt0209780 [Dactylella cylindrospora]|nr:hypothetical protein ABW19_dt0209780 [Dactylella cylindrospora]
MKRCSLISAYVDVSSDFVDDTVIAVLEGDSSGIGAIPLSEVVEFSGAAFFGVLGLLLLGDAVVLSLLGVDNLAPELDDTPGFLEFEPAPFEAALLCPVTGSFGPEVAPLEAMLLCPVAGFFKLEPTAFEAVLPCPEADFLSLLTGSFFGALVGTRIAFFPFPSDPSPSSTSNCTTKSGAAGPLSLSISALLSAFKTSSNNLSNCSPVLFATCP